MSIQLLNAQTIKVDPYLQNASPSAITIMWETNTGTESIVEWGLSNALGNTDNGTSEISQGSSRIHTVQLTGLSRFTKYYYRVRTGSATSAILSFKTPPFASDHESFRIVAMSDMQLGNDANKYYEVVHDGILDYFSQEFGGDVEDNLAMVLIPGDLVDDGENYAEWENEFFDPSTDLFGHVPVYPIFGNHEVDTDLFIKYFDLPTNGTSGFEEHWWYKDYGNVRIIGLDSNYPYDNEASQIAWLTNVLNQTCSNSDIDFVFAQLHHPHKSEMWTPGESNFTGDVITELEQFTTNCGKPSIHFFGHTHGYSRGNSRDHKHLWVNVASAGGNLDTWGEYPNNDYDEFSVSHDEFGFVVVEVTDDDDPKIVLKRLSRGDDNVNLDNELKDFMVIRLNPTSVNTPTPLDPVNTVGVPAECVTLKANAFSSPNNSSMHGQSHWQVATSAAGFDTPVYESWKNYQNWYQDVDTQAGDDLTDEKVSDLAENTQYWWRVRYRDRELNWSEWTSPTNFSTGVSLYSANLLTNPGSENNLNGWTTAEGIVESVTDGECDGTTPHSGQRYFAVGGLCTESEVGRCIQNVNVSSYSSDIDNGTQSVRFGGYLSDYGGNDVPEIQVFFLNSNNQEIGSSEPLSSTSTSWVLKTSNTPIPPLTRTIRMQLKGTRLSGTDNDSYIDDVFLKVGETNISCGINSMTLGLKVLLEGSYDENSQLMNDGLRSGNHLPIMEPYSQLSYTQIMGGGEQTSIGALQVTGNNAIVDWILVELRDGANPMQLIATQSALLQRDGDIVGADGFSNIVFDNLPEITNAFVVVKHRNHLSVGTANAYPMNQSNTIDLTNPSTEVFGSNSMMNIGGKMVLKTGDANHDGLINSVDKNIYWRPQNAMAYNYNEFTADFNLDGTVNGVDLNLLWRPNNPTAEQVYAITYAEIVSVTQTGASGNYNFQVGILSPDTGCDQYADWWEILTEDGDLIYRRVLGHSHVNEQSFIRSGGPVNITANQTVIIRAHMNNLGYGTQSFIGSVQEGFSIHNTALGFASDVEDDSPQPAPCAF